MNEKNVIYIENKLNGVVEHYSGATYTKFNGMYGYLCVEGDRVLFFWSNDNRVCMDELDNFIVHNVEIE